MRKSLTPDQLREFTRLVEQEGLSEMAAARTIGVPGGSITYYLDGCDHEVQKIRRVVPRGTKLIVTVDSPTSAAAA